MSISIVQNDVPQSLTTPQAARPSTPGGMAVTEREARLFRTLLATPDASPESGGTASQDGLVPKRGPITPPQGSMSARDLANAALWSSGVDRMDALRAEQRGTFDIPMSRSHRFDVLSQPALDSAAFWSPVAQPIPPEPNTAISPPDPGLSLTELIELHVRRTLLSTSADGMGADEVRIELSEAVLPGTTLSLKREPGGWQLAVVTANPQSRERIDRHADALVKRFAAASLGFLRVVPEADEANAR
jgi:Type III secretion protein (HpaP)